MVDTTTPPTQDLQINLEEAPKQENTQTLEDTSTELDLNLDLNLPDAPKDDDRLQKEDQKNNEILTISDSKPIIGPTTTNEKTMDIPQSSISEEILEQTSEAIREEEQNKTAETVQPLVELSIPEIVPENEIVSSPIIETREEPQAIENIPNIETITSTTGEEIPQSNSNEETIEQTSEVIKEEEQNTIPEVIQSSVELSTPEIVSENEVVSSPIIETREEPQAIENIPSTETITATTIEEIPQSSNEIGENIPENFCLQEDVKMIEELEGHGAGGLSPEVEIPLQTIPIETPKTFDLDAMLGNPIVQTTREISQTQVPQTIENIVPQTPKENSNIQQIPVVIAPIANTPIIPSITTQVPVQAISQTTIPQKKNVGVKVFLFLIMFLGLGFTTFFILKTMYPIEFANMFDGTNPTIISENSTGEELTGTEIASTENSGLDMSGIATTGEEQISDIIDTGTEAHASATGDENFGELNDLITDTDPEPLQNDVSKLTDYVNQGNTFLAQGKTMNNNTVIKYGLYISKKATAFLDDIANGKEINNLTGYFAQFDQYIVELQKLVEQTPNADATASATLPTNDAQDMTTDTPTPTGFGDASATQ